MICNFNSYHIISYHITSYHITSCHVICNIIYHMIMRYHSLSYIIFFHILSYYFGIYYLYIITHHLVSSHDIVERLCRTGLIGSGRGWTTLSGTPILKRKSWAAHLQSTPFLIDCNQDKGCT